MVQTKMLHLAELIRIIRSIFSTRRSFTGYQHTGEVKGICCVFLSVWIGFSSSRVVVDELTVWRLPIIQACFTSKSYVRQDFSIHRESPDLPLRTQGGDQSVNIATPLATPLFIKTVRRSLLPLLLLADINSESHKVSFSFSASNKTFYDT